MFDDDAINVLNKPISKNEVLSVLKSFTLDKCPGPDGWPSEFFLFFFDIMGNEIADVAEQFRVNGNIPANLNSMFIALVPKAVDSTSFGDFRLIALYNLIYKITSKLIANRIKTTLEKHISREQYGFLRGRSIHEAVAVAQEALHSMHSERREALIMKIDLMKAYDSLDWSLKLVCQFPSSNGSCVVLPLFGMW